jgi:hypothetical protein
MGYNHPPIWEGIAFLAAIVLALYLIWAPY